MKIKFLNVLNDDTRIKKIILLQVEELDEEFFKTNEIKAGYKIVIQLQGSDASASGGYEFTPEYSDSSLSDRSCKIQKSGIINTLGLLLNSVEDIKILPPIIDVNDLRESCISNSKNISIKNKLDELQDEGFDIINGWYKKQLYKHPKSKGYTIGIFDNQLKLIYQTSDNNKSIIGDYLWIPIDELSEKEWTKCIEYNDLFNVERVEA